MEEDLDENNTSRLLFDTNLVVVCEMKEQADNFNLISLHNKGMTTFFANNWKPKGGMVFIRVDEYGSHLLTT